METIHYEHLAGSPAEKLVARGMHEAFEAGHLLGFNISPEMEIIAGFDDDKKVVAFIVFDECVDYGEFWLTFGYCVPEWRRKGPYRDCIKELRRIADERGYTRIHTAVQQDNLAARSSIQQRGGTLQYLSYVFPVEERTDNVV